MGLLDVGWFLFTVFYSIFFKKNFRRLADCECWRHGPYIILFLRRLLRELINGCRRDGGLQFRPGSADHSLFGGSVSSLEKVRWTKMARALRARVPAPAHLLSVTL